MTPKDDSQSVVAATDDQFVVTKEGLKALETELEDLKTRGRKEVADQLKEAISYGDLSENSEYEDAKNRQAFMEGRILELERMIKTAKVVDEKQHSKQVIEIGTKVKVKNTKDAKEAYEITIVGATESDPFQGRVSSEAPMGLALMGAKVGDKVVVDAPAGKTEFEVLQLS